jgi:predicted acyltransferase
VTVVAPSNPASPDTAAESQLAPPSPPAPTERLQTRVMSIDALRGFDMFWIIGGKFVLYAVAAALLHTKDPPGWLKAQLEHTRWIGFDAYDLIMPLFLFIVGAAMPFSFAKHLSTGGPRTAIYRRMAVRFVVLWILGMMIQGKLLTLDYAAIQPFTNVLQAIACGYVVTGLVLLHVPRRYQRWITAGLLVVYWLAMTFIPAPGIGTGVFEDNRNLAAYIEQLVLGSHKYGHHAFILPILTFSAMVMLGMHAGQLLQSTQPAQRKLLWLVLAGISCLALGRLWSLWFPIIKPLFTSSMVLWSGGWCFLLLALFYGIIDVLGWRRWAFPFVVIGANALLAYTVSHLFMDQIFGMSRVLFGGIARLLEPVGWSGATIALGAPLLIWSMLWFFYRKKIFWKV